jgi:hypothetical protein
LNHVSPAAIYRITALWAFSEAFLGGILHALSIPFKGLILCSISVFCICLIGYYGKRSDILKELVLVILVKAALSPHSPPQAYVAVAFQGLAGYLFFFSKNHFKTSAILESVFSLIETPLQKIVNVLIFSTFVFGPKFWSAVNDTMKKFASELNMGGANLLYWAVGIYLGIHLIAGIILGIFISRIPKAVEKFVKENPDFKINSGDSEEELEIRKKRKKKFKPAKIFVIILIIFLFLNYLFEIFPQLIPRDESLQIFLRAVLLILFWLLVFSPLMKLLFRKWLSKATNKYSVQVRDLINFLPQTKKIITMCYKKIKHEHGKFRIPAFVKLLTANLIYD